MNDDDNADSSARRQLPRRAAHAIRTPLNVIDGLLQRLGGPVPDEQREKLRELGMRANFQLRRIADRLSLLARLERGDEMQTTRCDLADVVRGAVEDIARTRTRRRVHVDATQLDGDWHGDGDPTLLRSAVAELVDNAVRFARSNVTVRLERTDGVRVVVANDGPALQSDDVYRPFASADEAGLGIGLSMARRIARLHGGDVDHTKDESESGIAFALTLPWSKQ